MACKPTILSFRGAHEVREPGIQSDALCLAALDSGSGPSGRPGMTGEM
jgi:hypothetical protein